jgi:hypothetical protein
MEGKTKGYRVQGPGGVWSIWDHGDEMTVCQGANLTDRVVARVPIGIARKMDAGHKWAHVENAAGAIKVAALLGSDSPTFRMLWQSCG